MGQHCLESTSNSYFLNPSLILRSVAVGGVLMLTVACGGETTPASTVIFNSSDTQSDNPIPVTLEMVNLTEYWVTTNGEVPVKDNNCRHTANLPITIDQTSEIKVLYVNPSNGQDVHESGSYVINGTSPVNGWVNHEAIVTFEVYSIELGKRLQAQWEADGSNLFGQTSTINDGSSGTASISLSYNLFTNVATTTTTFNGYRISNFTSPSGLHFINNYSVDAGVINFSGDGDTNDANASNSQLVTFSGDYDGEANGSLVWVNDVLQTSSNYAFHCTNLGCSPTSVTYAWDEVALDWVELGAPTGGSLLSCTP